MPGKRGVVSRTVCAAGPWQVRGLDDAVRKGPRRLQCQGQRLNSGGGVRHTTALQREYSTTWISLWLRAGAGGRPAGPFLVVGAYLLRRLRPAGRQLRQQVLGEPVDDR